MKAVLLLVAVWLLLMVGTASAQTVQLVWDANEEVDLAGYILYQGIASRIYTTTVEIPPDQTTYTVEGLTPGTYFFTLRAYNTAGQQSAYSNEVSTVIGSTPVPRMPHPVVGLTWQFWGGPPP